MNYNDITVGIVTFKSEKVIFQCLKSIKKIKKIIIFDNSNDIKLKKKIAKIYIFCQNIRFFEQKNPDSKKRICFLMNKISSFCGKKEKIGLKLFSLPNFTYSSMIFSSSSTDILS